MESKKESGNMEEKMNTKGNRVEQFINFFDVSDIVKLKIALCSVGSLIMGAIVVGLSGAGVISQSYEVFGVGFSIISGLLFAYIITVNIFQILK